MLGTLDDFHPRKIPPRIVADRLAVGVDDDLRDGRALLKLNDNVVIQQAPRERTIVLPRHAPALMTHWDNGSDRRFHCNAVDIGVSGPITFGHWSFVIG